MKLEYDSTWEKLQSSCAKTTFVVSQARVGRIVRKMCLSAGENEPLAEIE